MSFHKVRITTDTLHTKVPNERPFEPIDALSQDKNPAQVNQFATPQDISYQTFSYKRQRTLFSEIKGLLQFVQFSLPIMLFIIKYSKNNAQNHYLVDPDESMSPVQKFPRPEPYGSCFGAIILGPCSSLVKDN